jgi:hypothetical protein
MLREIYIESVILYIIKLFLELAEGKNIKIFGHLKI